MWRAWINRRGTILVLIVGTLSLAALGAWAVYPYFSFTERFRRSKPSLERYATQVNAPGSAALSDPPRRLGYFNVMKTEPLPHGFLFQSDYGNPFDWSGIAYSTQPLPHGDGHNYFIPIEGNWYSVDRP
jgi:hypothetical protein